MFLEEETSQSNTYLVINANKIIFRMIFILHIRTYLTVNRAACFPPSLQCTQGMLGMKLRKTSLHYSHKGFNNYLLPIPI